MAKKSKLTMPKPDTARSLRRANCGVVPWERWWFVTDEGQLVRGLTWTDYSYCEFGELPREFSLRLAPDDPRPMGRRIHCGKYWDNAAYNRSVAAHYIDNMRVGQWYGDPLPQSRELRPYNDATALVIVPTTALVLVRREERAA